MLQVSLHLRVEKTSRGRISLSVKGGSIDDVTSFAIVFLFYFKSVHSSVGLPVIFKKSVHYCVSNCEDWLLSSDSELKLIECSLDKECLCGNTILTFYESLDVLRPEFACINDLEHTLVLLLLCVLSIE